MRPRGVAGLGVGLGVVVALHGGGDSQRDAQDGEGADVWTAGILSIAADSVVFRIPEFSKGLAIHRQFILIS